MNDDWAWQRLQLLSSVPEQAGPMATAFAVIEPMTSWKYQTISMCPFLVAQVVAPQKIEFVGINFFKPPCISSKLET